MPRFLPLPNPASPSGASPRFVPLGAPRAGGSGPPPLLGGGGEAGGGSGGTFGATGSTAPGSGPFGNPLGGSIASMGYGPVGIGLSPLGSIGVGLNFSPDTGNPGANSLINSIGNTGFQSAARMAGVPTSFNPLSFIGALAPVLGPAGMGLTGFNAMVALGNMIAQLTNTPTTQQALEHVTNETHNLNMPDSPLVTPNENVPLATAMAGLRSGQTGFVGQHDLHGLAAMSALGMQGAALTNPEGVRGYVPSNVMGVPLDQLDPVAGMTSGTKGAQATGAPGVPGVTFAAEGGLKSPVAPVTGIEGVSPTSPTGLSPADVDAAVAAEQGAAEGVGPAGVTGETGGVTGGDEGTGPGVASSDAGVGESGGDGGGGGGGGGCYLASWTLSGLKPKDAEESRKAFQSFYTQFMKANPDHGKRLFVTYQRMAQQIIQRARQANAERSTQEYIYRHFVQPTGEYISKKELPQAVKNLTQVVQTLARQFQIPMPRFVPMRG